MRTLATVDLYRNFGADQSADSTTCAFAVAVEGSWRIACGIYLIGLRYHMLGAEVNANFAAFAKLLVYLDVTLGAHLKTFSIT